MHCQGCGVQSLPITASFMRGTDAKLQYGLTKWEIGLLLEVETEFSATIKVDLRVFHGKYASVQNFYDPTSGNPRDFCFLC